MNEIDEDSTSGRLLDVAIGHFGARGLDGASTREIARDANTPMSSITYHFGGKEGLYLAAAERVSARMGALMAPAVQTAMGVCGPDGDATHARAALHVLVGRAAEVMLCPESAPIARFVAREQAEPTEAFQRLYGGAFGHMLGRFADLLDKVAGGTLGTEEARLRALSLVGQTLVFRTARASLLRAMGWEEIGDRELGWIRAVVADHLDAVLDRLARRPGRSDP